MANITSSQLSEFVRTEVTKWLRKFPPEQKRSGSLYALRMVQEEKGWISKEDMKAVADFLQIPEVQVYEVATFYSMYDLEPRGRNKIGICTNISCMLCGSKSIVEHVKNKLGIGFNETTADGKFYLQEVECLAACCGAPAMIVNDKQYHENLTPQKVDEILESLE